MDRLIIRQPGLLKHIKALQWFDIVPYSIALLLLAGEVYILIGFTRIAAHMR